ncbi:unnamed protein product [Sphacelaria rigidula]
MSSSANTDGLTEKGETRVMGLGIGVFLVFFFSLVSIVVCLVGATTPRPGEFACGGAGILGFVLLILVIAERESKYVEDTSNQIHEYDQTFYPRLALIFIMIVAALVGLASVCITHIGKPLRATPIYDQRVEVRRPIF